MITRDSYIAYMCSMCYIVPLSVLLIDLGKDKCPDYYKLKKCSGNGKIVTKCVEVGRMKND